MKISQDVREYAQAHGLGTSEAIEAGLAAKAKEFADHGGEVYLAPGDIPVGAPD
jgi:phosphomethylpyrimidine synthase